MFTEEALSILVVAGVGVLAVGATPPAGSLFSSTKAQIPTGPGPYGTFIETGGSGPEGTQNATGLPAYVRPNGKFTAVASTTAAARTMAHAAYAAWAPIRNRLVLNVWWREVFMLQEPFDQGLDPIGRAQWSFNIAVTKRPNAAMSV